MRINIVRPTDGWVLQSIAERWQLPDSVCSTWPDMAADVNIWCNYALFNSVGGMQQTNCDIGYFTHRETTEPLRSLFDNVAIEMMHCIAMCEKTAAHLPERCTTVIHTAPAAMYNRAPIVLGVVGREYPRKRNHLMELISLPGYVVRYSGGTWPAADMPKFYESLDYVLVLSDNEGGPMCVPEALAMGKPVIAPNVGWCWDYPVIRYTDAADLVRVVRGLTPPTIKEESAAIMKVVESCLS